MSFNNEPLEQYQKLTQFEQALLQFLSVVYEPPQPTLIVNCLRKLEMKNSRGLLPSPQNIVHYFNKFEQLGLLTSDKRCSPELVEIFSKIAVSEGSFARYAHVIRAEAPVSFYYGKWTSRCWRALREIRIGIYLQDYTVIHESLDFLESQCKEFRLDSPPIIQVIACPFDRSWMTNLPLSFQFYLLHSAIIYSQSSLIDLPEIIQYLAELSVSPDFSIDERVPFLRLLFSQFLYQAKFSQAKSLLDTHEHAFKGTGAAGALLFLSGNYQDAQESFAADLDFLKQFSESEPVAFFGLGGLFHILNLMQVTEELDYPHISTRIGQTQEMFQGIPEGGAYEHLSAFLHARSNQHLPAPDIALRTGDHSLTSVFAGLCYFWLNNTLTPELEHELQAIFEQAAAQRFDLVTCICAELLDKNDPGREIYRKTLHDIEEHALPISFVELFSPEDPWKRSLEALIHLSTAEIPANGEETSRLVWVVHIQQQQVEFTPREQKRMPPSGEWSKGRPVALSRLHQSGKLTFLSPQDRRICAAIQKIPTADGKTFNYAIDTNKALLAMTGHPLLFLDTPNLTPVELIKGEPELIVEERGDNLHIRFAQPISSGAISIHQESPTKIRIISVNDNHRRIAQITGKNGLIVPKSASHQVLTAIGNISSFMTVHSAIAADHASGLPDNVTLVDADPTIYMHLLPYGDGFRLAMFVKPFKESSHYLKPGQGVENIITEINGKRLQTRRNLRLEEEMARDIEELCPIFDLAMDMEQEADREWILQDPTDCLQALTELQKIRDKVTIEWPEGQRLAVTQQASFEQLNLKIRTNRQNWFSISGELTLDQDKVIELKELLAKVKKAQGRFIELGDGQFLALSQEFRKRLEELQFYATGSDDENSNELSLHPLAALSIEKLTNKAKTSADNRWTEHLQKIQTVQEFLPEVPSTLQAELRDYQREGFNWLARLAEWGVGGCLADDMGLGKTLQSLAIILKLASDGPSLVVTPTSVSTNWHSEISRFTPTLRICHLPVKDREQAILSLGKFDLLVTTYTLLQQEEELFSRVDWQTVILDEAQAIKNSATKRSRAAMSLKSKFRLITTGTPIENHLGELWNLFHFINPGLLGSLTSFNERYALPIERHQDREARRKLKKLIRPFILRRIKSQVLEELPSRTEITLDVELSPDEMTFYEALRQNALDILESNKDRKGRPLQILTEIMKLRQACCNPRLIDSDCSIQSSKLELFLTTVEELIESRHKVLVFSQFIGHLSILRESLDERGISYQYLDGATNAKLRKQRVDAFQAGEGDIFLISLKAGGLGLNLTAADYVIHMDPWWNPAIEDQASDRAHRIGQTRPVTIYRLVCKNTIEEKIVKLHQEKRDLAGSLLDGSDISAKMTSEELLDLIRES